MYGMVKGVTKRRYKLPEKNESKQRIDDKRREYVKPGERESQVYKTTGIQRSTG